jgi:hypothetical protein
MAGVCSIPRFVRAALAATLAGAALATAPVPAVHASTSTMVSLADVELIEGDAGVATVSVPIALSAPAPATVVAYWSVTSTSATPGIDFIARTGRTTFLVGQTQKNITVKLYGDAAVESDETVEIRINAVSGAAAADDIGVITMGDDDADGVSATPEVSLGRPAAWEGNAGTHRANVPITLSRPAPTDISVWFQTECGDPADGYTRVSRKVTFRAGQRSKTIAVRTDPDASPNADLVIRDNTSVVSGSAIVLTPQSEILVRDDDGAPTEPPLGVSRASEPADGSDPTFPLFACGGGYPESAGGSISADGRYVAFDSNANNLVPDDTNDAFDVFVKDLWTGAVERVSTADDGTEGNAASNHPTISADGRYVLFDSSATNLVPDDPNGWSDAFLYDRETDTISRIGDIDSWHKGSGDASISADGRYIAFSSSAVLAGDTDPCVVIVFSDGTTTTQCDWIDVFVWDRNLDAISLVSASATGNPSMGYIPSISADGRHVAYLAGDNGQVVPGDTNGTYLDAFVRDLDTGTIEMVSVNSNDEISQGWGLRPERPSISADGRYVGFKAEVCNLGVTCPSARNPAQIYIRDRAAGTTTLGTGAPLGQDASGGFSMTTDARYVVFVTTDPAISGWGGGCGDHVYQYDRVAGTTTHVDTSYVDGGCPNGSSWLLRSGASAVSADGRYVVFHSTASDLIPDDDDNAGDVFVARLR